MFSKKSSVETKIKDKYPDGLFNGLIKKFDVGGTNTKLSLSDILSVLNWGTKTIHPFVKEPFIKRSGGASLVNKKTIDRYFDIKTIDDFLKVAVGCSVSNVAYKNWKDDKNKVHIKDLETIAVNTVNDDIFLRTVFTILFIQDVKPGLTQTDIDAVTVQLGKDEALKTSFETTKSNLSDEWDEIKASTAYADKVINIASSKKSFWRKFSEYVLSSMFPDDTLNTAAGSDYDEEEQNLEEEEEEDKKEQHKPNYLDNSERPEVKEEPEPEQVEAPGAKQEEEDKKDDDNMSVATSATLKRGSSSDDDLFDIKPAKTVSIPFLESMIKQQQQQPKKEPPKKLTQEEIDAGVIGDEETEEERKAREEAERRQKLIDEENKKQAALIQQQQEEEEKQRQYAEFNKQYVEAAINVLKQDYVNSIYPNAFKADVRNIINIAYNANTLANHLIKNNAYDVNVLSNDAVSKIMNEFVKQYNLVFSDKGVYTKLINGNPNEIFNDVAKKGYVAKDDIFNSDNKQVQITFGSFVHTLNKAIDILNSIAERRGLPVIGKQPIQTSVSPVFKAMDMIEKNKNNPNILYNTNETTLITKSYWDKQNDKIIDDLVRSGTIIKMQRGTDGEEAYDYNGTKFTRDEILTTVKKAKISNLTQSRAVFNNLQLSQMRAGDRRRNRFERRKEKYISINKGAVTKVQKLFEEEKVKVGGMTLNPLLFRKSMC